MELTFPSQRPQIPSLSHYFLLPRLRKSLKMLLKTGWRSKLFVQIYLPAPQYIPRPKFDVPVPNKVHQADLLYLPHDLPPRSRETFKYALTVVDVASRFKEAEPLTTKEAREVVAALEPDL